MPCYDADGVRCVIPLRVWLGYKEEMQRAEKKETIGRVCGDRRYIPSQVNYAQQALLLDARARKGES